MASKSRWLLEHHNKRLSPAFQQAVNKSKSSNDIPTDRPSEDRPSEELSHSTSLVSPGYSRISEGLRKRAPSAILCLAFCGGRKCKFDSPDRWPKPDMAIAGLFSHWVTDDILAMARPNAELITKRDLVGQFIGDQDCDKLARTRGTLILRPPIDVVRFLIHARSVHVKKHWRDYDNGSLDGLLDAVKVLAFSVTQGRVAVHCHAGLGRTGVLLSCYLVYISRMRANEAINFVRRKRPRAVQTSGQIEMVHEFEHYLASCSNVYCLSIKEFGLLEEDSRQVPFTLNQHLEDQREILHGYEARALKYIPKIIYVLCERLLFLCRADPASVVHFVLNENSSPFTRTFYCSRFESDPNGQFALQNSNDEEKTFMTSGEKKTNTKRGHPISFQADDSATGCSKSKSYSEDLNSPNEEITVDTSHPMPARPIDLRAALQSDQTKVPREEVIKSLLVVPEIDLLSCPAVRESCLSLDGRPSAWAKLAAEQKPNTLACLFWYWLLHLDQPVLGNEELSYIVIYANKPDVCFAHFDQGTRYTIEYLLHFVQRLEPTDCDQRSNLLLRLAAVLTQQAVDINGISFLYGSRKRLGQGTLNGLMRFFNLALELFRSEDETDTKIN